MILIPLFPPIGKDHFNRLGDHSFTTRNRFFCPQPVDIFDPLGEFRSMLMEINEEKGGAGKESKIATS